MSAEEPAEGVTSGGLVSSNPVERKAMNESRVPSADERLPQNAPKHVGRCPWSWCVDPHRGWESLADGSPTRVHDTGWSDEVRLEVSAAIDGTPHTAWVMAAMEESIVERESIVSPLFILLEDMKMTAAEARKVAAALVRGAEHVEGIYASEMSR